MTTYIIRDSNGDIKAATEDRDLAWEILEMLGHGASVEVRERRQTPGLFEHLIEATEEYHKHLSRG